MNKANSNTKVEVEDKKEQIIKLVNSLTDDDLAFMMGYASRRTVFIGNYYTKAMVNGIVKAELTDEKFERLQGVLFEELGDEDHSQTIIEAYEEIKDEADEEEEVDETEEE